MKADISEKTCDVMVVGGGPGGSTIGALLAEDGYDVVLLEKDRHPRFHIGESLLPMNMPLLERLGVRDQVHAIGMPKYGIEFVSPWHSHVEEFEFAQAWDKSQISAYQVRRSVFDHVLLKNATAKGANVIEECRVTHVEFLPGGGALITALDVQGREQLWRAKFLVDASGRDTLLANQFRIKRANLRHNTAAIFGHFTNARRLAGKAEGHISIFWFDHGWFWFIPLADGTTSVGAVCQPEYVKTRTGDVTAFLMDTIALAPALADRLKDAAITGPATATGNYSYRADRMTGRNYIMIGDAFAFIDPVFSTGVYLAMSSAFRGAEVVKTCLEMPDRARTAMGTFDEETRGAIDTFSWYIYRITRPAFRDLFMRPKNIWRVEDAVLSLLAGDVFRSSPIHSRLLVFKAMFYIKTALLRLRGKEPPFMSHRVRVTD